VMSLSESMVVTRRTSSSVVSPRSIFRSAASRRVIMPCFLAVCLRMWWEARARISSRIQSFMMRISWQATRP